MRKLLFLIVIASSCSPVYVPNIRNAPMFRKGGEFQAALQVGNGIDGQVAMSITKHFGIIGNYNNINRENDSLRHELIEGGIGYFMNEEDMFFEIFAGYGWGESFSSGNIFNFENVTARYERYFIQPAIGINHDYIHFAFVPRISIVDFSEYTTGTLAVSINEKPKAFFEPAVVMKVNTESNRFYYTLQAGSSLKLSDNIYFDRRRYQIATGFGIRLGGVKPESRKSR